MDTARFNDYNTLCPNTTSTNLLAIQSRDSRATHRHEIQGVYFDIWTTSNFLMHPHGQKYLLKFNI